MTEQQYGCHEKESEVATKLAAIHKRLALVEKRRNELWSEVKNPSKNTTIFANG